MKHNDKRDVQAVQSNYGLPFFFLFVHYFRQILVAIMFLHSTLMIHAFAVTITLKIPSANICQQLQSTFLTRTFP